MQAEKLKLHELKQFQDKIKLGDDVASEALTEAAKVKLVRLLDSAVECIKRRTRVRDYTDAMTVSGQLAECL